MNAGEGAYRTNAKPETSPARCPWLAWWVYRGWPQAEMVLGEGLVAVLGVLVAFALPFLLTIAFQANWLVTATFLLALPVGITVVSYSADAASWAKRYVNEAAAASREQLERWERER